MGAYETIMFWRSLDCESYGRQLLKEIMERRKDGHKREDSSKDN